MAEGNRSGVPVRWWQQKGKDGCVRRKFNLTRIENRYSREAILPEQVLVAIPAGFSDENCVSLIRDIVD